MDRKISRKVPARRTPYVILSLLIFAVFLTICILFWKTWKEETVLPEGNGTSSGTQANCFTDSSAVVD